MKQILDELVEKKNVRSNLSQLRQHAKNLAEQKDINLFFDENPELVEAFFVSDDAKTRKNIGLLLGDIGRNAAIEQLLEAYMKEETRFVKPAYLQSMAKLDVADQLPVLKKRLEELTAFEPAEEEKKHIGEEISALHEIIIRQEGISSHTMDYKGKTLQLILLVNKLQRELVLRMLDGGKAKIHPLGVLVETDDLDALMNLRVYRDILFPLEGKGLVSGTEKEIGKAIYEGNLLGILDRLHKEQGVYYFRIECKSPMTLEQRSSFTKKLARELEQLSKGRLVNSTGEYEIEIRLIATKEGEFFPCLKLFTLKDKRFTYRKNAIATSIHPSLAALIVEIASTYLKEGAQVIDPFCGVGTMLIERNKRMSAADMYATDIYSDAITRGRENAQLAGMKINFINRDFFQFTHDYLFDEMITNMPVRGKKTKQEMDEFYKRFFEKAKEVLKKDAIMILYTNEMGFVKKQLRLHKEYKLLLESCVQMKTDFNVVVIQYKG